MSETVLKVDNLNLTYSKGGPQVLFDISFAVSSKDFYAIIGPSGAGKSSLIRCINKLASPNSGEVDFKGEKLLKQIGINDHLNFVCLNVRDSKYLQNNFSCRS